MLWANETGSGLGGRRCVATLGVREEGDSSAIGGVERRDVSDGPRRLSGIGKFGYAKTREFLE